jgi:peroxiredoxin
MDNLSARKVDYAKFEQAGVQLLGISGNNPFSQKAIADSLKLPYPLLSDLPLEVARKYGVLYGTTKSKDEYPINGLVAKRAFFLIDRQGIVRGRWLGEDMTVFPTDVLLKAVREVADKR